MPDLLDMKSLKKSKIIVYQYLNIGWILEERIALESKTRMGLT